jgi:S-adenosylmethionine decarboxylase
MDKKTSYHTLIDLYDVDFELIDNMEKTMSILRNISSIVNLTILKESFHKFEPQGLSAILLLSESHISIHTWPEKNMACLDIFSCKNNPEEHVDNIVKLFNTNQFKHTTIYR